MQVYPTLAGVEVAFLLATVPNPLHIQKSAEKRPLEILTAAFKAKRKTSWAPK